ncbi:hypothetical protein BXO88_12545 [Oribacterium sp. C9]|uniref:DUF6672 family protein n=1 Tax=Oribacterium sp. C9 TaxID=1943579 RepID=UPI00098EAA11|nr:DUF6672 family protein [Oribacterium sp. C9]OON85340.1 hypothetical protein BXO88_12545 [Oribacterium sp. C9]
MDKSKKRRLIYRIAAFVVILLIAAAMFIIGRGHTVYFDNKMPENVGTEVSVPYKIEVIVADKTVAKLKSGERGMADTMGQNFKMQLLVTKEKGGDAARLQVGLKLPYNMDGIIINLPALLAGLDENAYLSEFVYVPSAEEMKEEEVVTDDTDGQMNFEG